MFKISSARAVALGILVIAGANTGCSSESEPSGPPQSATGAIALSLNLGGVSVEETGQRRTTATVARSGGFRGDVEFAVSGVPVGVSVTIVEVRTTGTITQATIVVTVDSTAAIGVYPMVVHARGSGVAEVTASCALTVQAAPEPGYAIAFAAPPALHIVKEYRTASTDFLLYRTNFLGDVALTVDNLPAGVTAAFAPRLGVPNGMVLTLTATDSAPLGTFDELIIRGVAAGLADRTAALRLTITEQGFVITLGVQAVTIVRGTAATIAVNVVRTSYLGSVSFTAEGIEGGGIPGVEFTFQPAATSGGATVCTIAVSPSAIPGTYTMYVIGEGGADHWSALPVEITIKAP